MSDQNNTHDHTETIERARDLLDKVTPGRWEWGDTEETEDQGDPDEITQIASGAVRVAYTASELDLGYNLAVPNPADADAIEAVPLWLAALDALADENAALAFQLTEKDDQIALLQAQLAAAEQLERRAMGMVDVAFKLLSKDQILEIAPRLSGDGPL